MRILLLAFAVAGLQHSFGAETTPIDQSWLQGTGTFHSEDLHITERYTRVGKDRIDYEAKLEDPKVFTKPWVIHSSMMLREGTRLQENVCAENNTEPARFGQA